MNLWKILCCTYCTWPGSNFRSVGKVEIRTMVVLRHWCLTRTPLLPVSVQWRACRWGARAGLNQTQFTIWPKISRRHLTGAGADSRGRNSRTNCQIPPGRIPQLSIPDTLSDEHGTHSRLHPSEGPYCFLNILPLSLRAGPYRNAGCRCRAEQFRTAWRPASHFPLCCSHSHAHCTHARQRSAHAHHVPILLCVRRGAQRGGTEWSGAVDCRRPG